MIVDLIKSTNSVELPITKELLEQCLTSPRTSYGCSLCNVDWNEYDIAMNRVTDELLDDEEFEIQLVERKYDKWTWIYFEGIYFKSPWELERGVTESNIAHIPDEWPRKSTGKTPGDYSNILVDIIDFNPHNVCVEDEDGTIVNSMIQTRKATMTPRMQDRDDYQRPTRKQHVELKESFISRSREGYLDKHGYEMTIRELQTIMKYNEIDDTRHQFRRDHVINEKVAKVTKEPMVIVEAINLVELIVT